MKWILLTILAWVLISLPIGLIVTHWIKGRVR